MRHIVHMIAISDYEGDLLELVLNDHVWLLKSNKNDIIAKTIWSNNMTDGNKWRGLTTFTARVNLVDSIYSNLVTIDEHHCEYSYSHPWDELRIHCPTDVVLDFNLIKSEFKIPVSINLDNHGIYTITKKSTKQNDSNSVAKQAKPTN